MPAKKRRRKVSHRKDNRKLFYLFVLGLLILVSVFLYQGRIGKEVKSASDYNKNWKENKNESPEQKAKYLKYKEKGENYGNFKDVQPPSKKIVIGLPFDTADPPSGMEPLGETINHPPTGESKGHSGIDFQWDHPAKILAVADGTIKSIEKEEGDASSFVVDINHANGFMTRYIEIGKVANGLKAGSKVKKGQVLGTPEGLTSHYQVHWEFGFNNFFSWDSRLCPLPYFDKNSKSTILNTWESVSYANRSAFPNLCTGVYLQK